jgi:hypothetical protein
MTSECSTVGVHPRGQSLAVPKQSTRPDPVV